MSAASFATYSVCGVSIAALRPLDAAGLIVDLASAHVSWQVHLCNAYTISLLGKDRRLTNVLHRADMNLPDGAPVAWLGRSVGTAGPVRGPDLCGDVVRLGVTKQLRHYYYGGAEGVALSMVDRLSAYAPGMSVAGIETPPFRDLDEVELRELAGRITSTGAHVVWVGLGTPRQDHLVYRLAPLVEAVIVPVGAAFNFWAGTVSEAPKLLRGSGFEWVYRLAKEPGRLWRRYLIGNPRFLLMLASSWRRDRRHWL